MLLHVSLPVLGHCVAPNPRSRQGSVRVAPQIVTHGRMPSQARVTTYPQPLTSPVVTGNPLALVAAATLPQYSVPHRDGSATGRHRHRAAAPKPRLPGPRHSCDPASGPAPSGPLHQIPPHIRTPLSRVPPPPGEATAKGPAMPRSPAPFPTSSPAQPPLAARPPRHATPAAPPRHAVVSGTALILLSLLIGLLLRLDERPFFQGLDDSWAAPPTAHPAMRPPGSPPCSTASAARWGRSCPCW